MQRLGQSFPPPASCDITSVLSFGRSACLQPSTTFNLDTTPLITHISPQYGESHDLEHLSAMANNFLRPPKTPPESRRFSTYDIACIEFDICTSINPSHRLSEKPRRLFKSVCLGHGLPPERSIADRANNSSRMYAHHPRTISSFHPTTNTFFPPSSRPNKARQGRPLRSPKGD